MPGVILSTTALAVVNKGGGYPTKTVVERHRDEIGRERKQIRYYRSKVKIKGTDYVVFQCPGCGVRNKRSVYDSKGAAGQSLSFKCNRCLREIEVARPAPTIASLITAPGGASPGGLVDPRGRPLGA